VKWGFMAVFMLHVLIECSGAGVIYPYKKITNRTLHRIWHDDEWSQSSSSKVCYQLVCSLLPDQNKKILSIFDQIHKSILSLSIDNGNNKFSKFKYASCK
jgi:hypothetical protein